jgi:hypothetical protein
MFPQRLVSNAWFSFWKLDCEGADVLNGLIHCWIHNLDAALAGDENFETKPR